MWRKRSGFELGSHRNDSSDLVYSATITAERDLTEFYDKFPLINRKFKNQVTTQKLHQNFDYTMIADRLRTVSWSYYNSHPTGVVTLVYDHSTFPLITKAVYSKGRIFKNLYIILLLEDQQ